MKSIVIVGITASVLGIGLYKKYNEQNKKYKLEQEKRDLKIDLLCEWLQLKRSGKELNTFFADKNVKSIAIYGMDYLGYQLYQELKNSDVIVRYAIDNGLMSMGQYELQTVSSEDELPEVDMIVVAAISHFTEIKEKLSQHIPYNIVSLEEVVYCMGEGKVCHD